MPYGKYRKRRYYKKRRRRYPRKTTGMNKVGKALYYGYAAYNLAKGVKQLINVEYLLLLFL